MPHRLRWLSHSGWELTTAAGARIFIDPWLSGNPLAPVAVQELEPAQFVLLTHDHDDHASDVPAVLERTGAALVGQPEIVDRYGGGREGNVGMNIGGTVDLGAIRVTMTDAFHSSRTGMPAGYIITLEDGLTIYHAGDTGLHANMATWGELFKIDVALLPIGDRFTMDGAQAARALKMLRPKLALPMHYKTFPLLAQSADSFIEHARVHAPGVEVRVLEPGAAIELSGAGGR